VPTRESLTYAEAQKMVEFEIDGRVTRVSIFDPLPLMSKEEFEAKYGRSNDSVSILIFLNNILFYIVLLSSSCCAVKHNICRLIMCKSVS
jgi:hypothetical protein